MHDRGHPTDGATETHMADTDRSEGTTTPNADAIVTAARAGGSGGPSPELRAAVEAASPDERGAAAKELAGDEPARQALLATVQSLGIGDWTADTPVESNA